MGTFFALNYFYFVTFREDEVSDVRFQKGKAGELTPEH
jgi:hypothetical protein